MHRQYQYIRSIPNTSMFNAISTPFRYFVTAWQHAAEEHRYFNGALFLLISTLLLTMTLRKYILTYILKYWLGGVYVLQISRYARHSSK